VKRLTFFFSAFAFVSLLSACGQSGPLYLPGDPSTIAVPTSAETASETESESESESDNAPDSSESPEATEDD